MNDPLDIFTKIKAEVLKKFPGSKLYAYGSRTDTGWKIRESSKLDFDVFVCNSKFRMDASQEHIDLREEFSNLTEMIKDKYTDEFGRQVDVDFFFTDSETSKGIEI